MFPPIVVDWSAWGSGNLAKSPGNRHTKVTIGDEVKLVFNLLPTCLFSRHAALSQESSDSLEDVGIYMIR